MLKSRLIPKILNLGLATSLVISTATPVAFADNSTLNGQLNKQQNTVNSTWSQQPAAAKVMTGTVAGAALGGVTGLFTGLTMHATSHHAMKMDRGTAVARGLGWGSVYGAGIGFLAGLASAITSPKPVAVSTIGSTGSQ